jgi:predicted GIY-YIG superfamily endonuclease
MKAHTEGKGSKCVRAKGFKELLRVRECKDKIEAFQLEYRIKKLHKSEKLDFFD